MPARTGNTYTTPKGVVNTKKKTYTGKGPGPAGTKKVAEPSYTEVPTVTVSNDGSVSTSGFSSQQAARRAQRAQKARSQRVRRIINQTKTKPQKLPTPKPYTAPDIPKVASSIAKAISSAPKAAQQEINKAAATAAKLPEKKVTRAFGKPTLGTPKVKEVIQAKREGRLSGVHKGKVVATPQARKAKKQLKRAQRVYAKKAKPQISGLLNEEQERFAEALSKYTKLPPKLAGDWTLKESGASSAGAGGEAGEQNQLGVGYPAHPTSFSQSPYFNNTTPEKAAKATADWMKGKIGGEYGYQAAPSIQQIPKLAKAGASEAELRAYIAGPSAWGTGEIPNNPQVTASPGKAGPKVTAKLRDAEAQAKKLGIKPTTAKGSSDPLPAKKRKGEWAGTKDILIKAARGIQISSEKRTPGHNAAIGGSPTSDHLTTNENSYATDLPASGAALNQIGSKVAGRLGVTGWTPGNYNWYTTPKYPGYRFQILSEVEGHYDHVHVGAEWTGESLPKGTSSGGVISGGPGGVSSVGGVAASEYASATGQSVGDVGKEVKAGKLTPQEIYEKLESLGVSVSKPSVGQTKTSQPSTSVLDELERKYGVAA